MEKETGKSSRSKKCDIKNSNVFYTIILSITEERISNLEDSTVGSYSEDTTEI